MKKKQKEQFKNRGGRKYRAAAAVLALGLSILCAACGGTPASGAGKNAAESDTAANGAGTPADGTDGKAEAGSGAGAASNGASGGGEASGLLAQYLTKDGSLDLDKLHKINEDIYAWLEIPGTAISFPVLQSAQDETLYLTHNESGEPDDGGCIYTEYFNQKDFSDPNTVIYGRNVAGRFGELHEYQDRDFFDNHRELRIYLADRVLTYRIFAAYPYDDRHLIKIYDFSDEQIFSNYLNDVFAQRGMETYIDENMAVTAKDKIITLSTGVTGQDDARYLVQAVLQSGSSAADTTE